MGLGEAKGWVEIGIYDVAWIWKREAASCLMVERGSLNVDVFFILARSS